MKVKNLGGSSSKSPSCPNCGSWLNHWSSNGGGKIPSSCSVKGCTEDNVVGGHVIKVSIVDKKRYIIPICKKCNGRNNVIFDIKESRKLVLANVDETCGK
jgi:hypothetical protein